MFEIKQVNSKEWLVCEDGFESIKLTLTPSTVTNKYFIVTKFIERVAEFHGEDFSHWFINFLADCQNEEVRPKLVVDSVPVIKEFCNKYLDSLTVDYSKFVDETKVKKNSIFFEVSEIKKIIQISSYLKIYSVISNNEHLRLGQKLHKEVYNKFASELAETEIIRKIYDVVKTKTFKYNLSDKFMWEYIKNILGKDIASHVIEIFNFIMNHILVLCEEEKNPITYFVGVIDESVKWFLRSVYKGSIVYDDSISTEDIQGINIDNLKTYSYNDTLGRLKGIAYEKIYEVLQKMQNLPVDGKDEEEYIISFHNRASQIQFVSPLCESLVFPMLSEITKIPYSHFRTLSAEHASVLSVYTQLLLRRVFSADYKDLFSLLNYYPTKNPSLTTTYKIKSIHDYLNIQQGIQNFFGFNSKILPHTLLCHFIGRISRVDFEDILTGKKMGGIPLSKIEGSMISFFTLYFAGRLESQIKEMTRIMNNDF